MILDHWDDLLHLAASITTHAVVPSTILKKLSASPKESQLAKALRELGRIERSLFMLEWYSSPALRRRCQAGLNKGEAAHKLKRAVFFHERGEIRLARGKGAKDSPRTDALRDLDMLVGAMVLPCGADENLATEILQACAIPPAPTA